MLSMSSVWSLSLAPQYASVCCYAYSRSLRPNRRNTMLGWHIPLLPSLCQWWLFMVSLIEVEILVMPSPCCPHPCNSSGCEWQGKGAELSSYFVCVVGPTFGLSKTYT